MMELYVFVCLYSNKVISFSEIVLSLSKNESQSIDFSLSKIKPVVYDYGSITWQLVCGVSGEEN
jgi:hypothetical protein